MKVVYTLAEAGWATSTVSDGDKRREMTISYLTNAPLDMIKAAIAILEGAESVRFSFDDEPGEHRWIIQAKETNEALQVRVLWFDDICCALPDEAGVEVFRCYSTRRAFAGEIRAALREVLQRHGMKGYKRRWVNARFPIKRLRQLEHRLHTLEGGT